MRVCNDSIVWRMNERMNEYETDTIIGKEVCFIVFVVDFSKRSCCLFVCIVYVWSIFLVLVACHFTGCQIDNAILEYLVSVSRRKRSLIGIRLRVYLTKHKEKGRKGKHEKDLKEKNGNNNAKDLISTSMRRERIFVFRFPKLHHIYWKCRKEHSFSYIWTMHSQLWLCAR